MIFAVGILFMFSTAAGAFAAGDLTCWFPPGWKSKAQKAKAITAVLSKESGLVIKPRIARSYPEILRAFDSDKQNFVYVGSFVQAIIHARGIGKALVQSVNGKELYCGIMIYPKGQDPEAILKNHPSEFAFAVGASSGESSAKAATNGKASIGTANHGATAGAVKVGKAKAGIVKNWWWEAKKNKYPELDAYMIPGISETKNPDNVLTASKSVPEDVRKKVSDAAIAGKDVFGAKEMVLFDTNGLAFSLSLMEKGKIDPHTYTWN